MTVEAKLANSERSERNAAEVRSEITKKLRFCHWSKWVQQPDIAGMVRMVQVGNAAGRLQGLEEAQCDKQFHMYVWTKEPFFYAVAQARSVHEARTLMLEEVGSGDGSCPEREEAAKWIKEQQPFIFHRENATFALTDSAEQVEMSAYIEKLQQKLAKRAECKCWCGKECGCPCHDGTIREKANG
jgi:hypothetical protein